MESKWNDPGGRNGMEMEWNPSAGESDALGHRGFDGVPEFVHAEGFTQKLGRFALK